MLSIPIIVLLAVQSLTSLVSSAVTTSDVKRSTGSTGASNVQLKASIHPDLDKNSLEHIVANSSASLFYTQNGQIYLTDPQLVATLQAKFLWDTVILDHSAWIKSVVCQPNNITVGFNNLTAYDVAKANWTRDDEIVLVSSATNCHKTYPGQFGFFNVTQITFNSSSLSAFATGSQISMQQAVAEFNVVWGEYETATTSTIPGDQANIAASTSRLQSSTSSKKSSSSAKTTSITSGANTTKTTKISSTSTSKSSSISSTKSTSTSSAKSTTTSVSTSSSKSASKFSTSSAKSSLTTSSKTSSKTSSSSSLKTSTSSSTSASSSSKPLSPSISTSTRTSTRVSAISIPPLSSTSIAAVSAVPAASSSPSSSSTSSSSTSSSSTSSSSTSNVCAALPTAIPSGLPTFKKSIPCGTGFDQAVDDWLTYIGDDSNLDAALAGFAPGVPGLTTEAYEKATGLSPRRSLRARIAKRDFFTDACNWVDDNIIEPVVNTVEEVVTNVIDVVEVLSDVAEEALQAIRQAAEDILPSYSPSISFTIPVDIEAPDWMLTDSPFGDAYQIYQYQDGEGDFNYGVNADSLAKLVGADELLTFQIDGVTQLPEPGVTLYCVDCHVTGSIKTTGYATYTLLVGFTELALKFAGNLEASVQLGLNAYMDYNYEVAKIRILEVGVPGFYIPEVITVGPMITLDVDATIEIQALGQVLAGAILEFDNIGAYVDLFDFENTNGHGFVPQVTPVFNVSGQINATASVGIPVGMGIGIDILDGAWTKEIAVIDRPGIEAVAMYTAEYDAGSGGDTNTGDCSGIYWYANFFNELTLDIFDASSYDLGGWDGPAFLSGCVGDDGVSTVEQQQQPPTAGSTIAGCTLQSEAIVNGGFETITNNQVLPWYNSQSPGTSMYVEDTANVDGTEAMRWYATGMDNSQTYTGQAMQSITVCTDSLYDVTFTARELNGNGACFVSAVQVYSNTNSNLNVAVNVTKLLPIGGSQTSYGPYHFSIPSFNNDGSETMWVAIEFSCEYASAWDIALDDVSVYPDSSDSKRKRALPFKDESSMWLTSEAVPHLMKRSNLTQPSVAVAHVAGSPAVSTGNSIPQISASGVAPPVPVFTTSDSPSATPNYAAPAASGDYQAPSIAYVPTTLPSGSQPATANPTAFASSLGPATYSFPDFAVLMASATDGVVGTIPSATPGSNSAASNGYSQLADLTGAVQLATADDGNLYLTQYPGTAPGTSFLSTDSVIIQDETQRAFHYYPDTMSTYGVSRIRVADVASTPLTAQLVTLIPVSTSSGTVYAAADTLGNTFLLAWCSAADWPGAKVFLTSDYTAGLQTLQSDAVQWIVTGDEVTACNPLLLTSAATPIS